MSLRLALSAALLVPCLAAAAELGRLTVLSGVGEPLRAEIEIVAVRPGEAAALAARIPPAEVFWRANLEPAPVLDELRVGVEPRAHGRHVVAIRSARPIEDPFIQLLVELASPAGSVVREYPFLLEEPRARRPEAAAPEAPAAPRPPGEDGAPPLAVPAGGYVVKADETLALIAEGLRPAGVGLEQMIVALYQANEPAFVDRDMNRLRAREVLTVPTADTVRAIEPAAARRIILEHRAAFEAYRRRLAGAAAVTAASARRAEATPAVAATARTAGDRLRLSRGDERKGGDAAAGAARDDDLAALQQALGETRERIALLERSIGEVTQLAALRNRELARMQGNAQASAATPTSAPRATPTSAPRATATAAGSGERNRSPTLGRLFADYGAWLMIALVAGFVSWIVMPFKTLRLWLKKRGRQARKARRAAERVRRAARDAGLLASSI